MVETLRFPCDFARNQYRYGFLQLVVHFVANAPDGQYVSWCVRGRLNFFSQFPNERHDIAVIEQVIIRPYGAVDLFLCEDFSSILSKKVQDVKLFRRQRDFFPGSGDPTAFGVDFQLSDTESVCLRVGRKFCFS